MTLLRRTSATVRPLLLGVVALGIGGCASDSVLDPASPDAQRVANLGWVLFGTATAVTVGVFAYLVVGLFRRHGEIADGDRPDDERAAERSVIQGGVFLPIVVLLPILGLGVYVLDVHADPTMHIEVIGHQYWWEYRYTDEGFETANELHIPIDTPVELTLRSDDVIHSFWVPSLGGKTDLIPGHTNTLTIQADHAGTFRGKCAEYCGLQHAKMLFLVVAQSPDDYARWVDHQRARRRPVPRSGGHVVRDEELRVVPHRARHRRPRTSRSRPDARGDPAGDRCRRAPEHAREHAALDRSHLGGQGPHLDARPPPLRRRGRRHRHLPGVAQVTLIEPPPTMPHTEPELAPLEPVWADSPGIAGYLTTVDHKRIGRRYLVTAFVFLLLGGMEAMVMRTQLASANGTVIDADTYNALMTMHGTTMIFLFNTPVFAGFGNYLVPLQIGARDMAFPRLNALSYWIFVLSGTFIYASFAMGQLPQGGWFAYVPLTDTQFLPGAGMDFWAVGQVFLGLSTTIGAINFIVTILRMRTPGMSLGRLPLFCWGILSMAFMIVFAVPSVTLAGVLLELQRMGMHFFTPALGGDPILFQHLFWIWGHPEVYLLFIPATGIISMVIPAFTHRAIVGYRYVVAALVSTAFVSFGLWIHHMFAVDLPLLVASFFSAASVLIAIPSGVQIFAWVTTIFRAPRRPRFEAPFLYALAFIVTFVIGGMSGVMVALVPFDLQVHDSYFVVAHFHYVLMGGTVFPTFAGLHFWYPKMTGRMLHRTTSIVAFWFIFIGFHVTFFPQHILGLWGMPRRIYWYDSSTGWSLLNMISTIGAFTIAVGMALMAFNFVRSRYRGAPAPADPWGGESLEWTVSSQPPDHNFREFPIVTNHHPAWDRAEDRPYNSITHVGDEDLTVAEEGEHRTLLSSPVDATEIEVITMPPPSYWPFALGLTLFTLAAAVVSRSLLVGGVGVAVFVVCLVQWQREIGS